MKGRHGERWTGEVVQDLTLGAEEKGPLKELETAGSEK